MKIMCANTKRLLDMFSLLGKNSVTMCFFVDNRSIKPL